MIRFLLVPVVSIGVPKKDLALFEIGNKWGMSLLRLPMSRHGRGVSRAAVTFGVGLADVHSRPCLGPLYSLRYPNYPKRVQAHTSTFRMEPHYHARRFSVTRLLRPPSMLACFLNREGQASRPTRIVDKHISPRFNPNGDGSMFLVFCFATTLT